MLIEGIAERLKHIIAEVCQEHQAEIVQLDVTPDQVQIETLAQRMEHEAVSRGSVLMGCPVIGAWAKLR